MLADVDTAVEPVYTGREALDDPQVRARGFFEERGSDGFPGIYFPALFSGKKLQDGGIVPGLGQDKADQFLHRQ